jgi:glycosyltransferase involved in cell wall biosynthesis
MYELQALKKKKIIRASTIPRSLVAFFSGVLKELSEKYDVIALSSPGELLDVVAKKEGIRVIAVPMERRISFFKDIKSLIILVKVFHKERPDMVHSITPKAGMLCMVAARITNVPIRVHTFTGLVFPTSVGLKKKLLMLTDKITCICATHIIPEGEGVKKDLITNGITKKDLKVLGFGNVRGVDMLYYDKRDEVIKKVDELNLRKTEVFTFLFVGRIVKDKGINELCSAFQKLSDGISVRLILVGKSEEDLDPISEEAKYIIENNHSIEYVGPKFGDELLAYYAAADCFVFPSYREGFPNTVLEAGAMGLPCIVTDINGSNEIIKDGFNGLIVPSHNEHALFEAMKQMATYPDLRKSMASVSRDHISAHYEQGYVRKCLNEFYSEILK